MASLGELFYEAGVKISGLAELGTLEERLAKVKEKTTITLDVSGVNLLKELNQESIKTSEALQRVGETAMSIKAAFTDVYGKGNTYKEASKDLDKLLDRQKLLVSSFNNLASIGSNSGLANNYEVITKGLNKYINEFSTLSTSMKTVLNEAGKDEIGPRRYKNIESQITSINSMVSALQTLKTAYDDAMKKPGTTVAEIRDTVFKAFQEFPNGLQHSLKEMAHFEQQFMSVMFNMGKNATPAMNEAIDNFRKSLSKSYSGFDLGALTIQEVWVKNITPERGAVKDFRNALYDELKKLEPLAVDVVFGKAERKRKAKTDETEVLQEPKFPKADVSPQVQYEELRKKALSELSKTYKDEITELDSLATTIDGKLAKLKDIYKRGKSELESQKPIATEEKLLAFAASQGIDLSTLQQVASEEKKVGEETKKTTEAIVKQTEAEEKTVSSTQKAAETLARQEQEAEQVRNKLAALGEQWKLTFSDVQVKGSDKLLEYFNKLNDPNLGFGAKKGAEKNAKDVLGVSLDEIKNIRTEFDNLSKNTANAPFANELKKVSTEALGLSNNIQSAIIAIRQGDTSNLSKDFGNLGGQINNLIGLAQRFREILTNPVYNQGIIDLRGPGTSLSDSIKAFLSVGESVMSAETTKLFKSYLYLFQALGNNLSMKNLPQNEASTWVNNVQSALLKLQDIAPNDIFKTAIANLQTIGELTEKDRAAIIGLLNDASKPFLKVNPDIASRLKQNGDFYASRYTRPGYDDTSYLKGQNELREQIRQEQELARAAEMTARQLEARQRAMALGQLSGRQIFSGIIDVTAEQNQLQAIGNAIEYLKQKIMANPERSFFEDVAKEINRIDTELSNSIVNINAYKDILKNQNLANSPVALEAADKLREEQRLYEKLIADRQEYAALIAPGKSKNLDEMNTLYGRIDNMKAVYDDLATQIQKVNDLNSGTERRIADLGAEKDAIMALAQAWDNLIATNKVYDANGNFSPEALSILEQYKQRVDNIKSSTQTLSEAEKQRVKQEQDATKEQEKNQKNLDKLHEKYSKLSDTLSKLKNQRDIDVQNGLKTDRIDNVINHYERLLRVLRSIMESADPGRINKALSKIGTISGTANTIAGNAKAWDRQENIALAYKRAIDGATSSVVEHKNALKDSVSQALSLQNQFSQLGMTIQNTFSVVGLQQFANEIIRIGGEIEKQKLAMGSILGGQDKAEAIYQDISKLSMVSPFTVEDIMKYSKQLSAFGIQYDELYDTTRRLADIAAGVGVDFGRIAYEYGQTSSRGWLDARELRMFANSGIPLLQKLSDHYSKLRDEMVSTSQVREMISKREVSFGDVKTVLWNMTDEGGTFFHMQEVMADSLAAKYANLRNAWNLMLADLAQNSGIGSGLKDLATVLTKLTQSWDEIMPQVATFTATLATMKLMSFLSSKAVTDETTSLLANAAANKKTATEELIRLNIKHGATEATIMELEANRELTAQNLRQLVVSKKLTEQQARQAIINGALGQSFKKLSKDQKKALLTSAGFSKEFANSVVGVRKLSAVWAGLGTVIKSVWASFVSFLPTAAIFAAIAGLTKLYSMWRKAGELQRELKKISKENEAETEKITSSLEYYAKKLDAGNLSLEERIKLIDKLKSEYGEYLGDLNEEADVQKRIAEAIDSVNKNSRLKRKQEQIEKVRDYYGEKIDEQSEKVKKYFNNNYSPAEASDIYNEFLRMAEAGYSASEIRQTLKKAFGVNAFPESISKYVGYRDVRDRKIAQIEGDDSDLTRAEKTIKRIESYWDDVNKNTDSYTEKLQNDIEKTKSIIEVLTTKAEDGKVNILGGIKSDSIVGFGDLYDANSEIVQKYKAQLEDLERASKLEWKKVAHNTLEGVRELEVNGEKISSAAIVESLKPNDKMTDLEYYKELAKKHKENQEALEKDIKLKEQQMKVNPSLWGFDQEKRLVREEETDRMLEVLQKALGIDYADYESGSKNKNSQEIIKNIQNLKKAYDEYKKFADLYGHDEGLMQWTKTDRYKREFADVNINDIKDFRKALEKAYNEASADPRLKEAASQISDIIIQFDMDFSNKSVEQAVSKLKDKMSEDLKRFDFYNNLLAVGFNENEAYAIALKGIEKSLTDGVANSIKDGARKSIKELINAFKVATGTFEEEVQEVSRMVPKTRKDFLLRARAAFINTLSSRSFVPKGDVEAFANIMTAQLAKESGYGESGLSKKYNNFGGHKPGVKGKHVVGVTNILNNKAGNDPSRYNIYDSLEGFIEDQVDYVNRVWNAYSDGVDKYFWHLQDEFYGKKMYATVDLPPAPGKPQHGKGTYEKSIRGKYLADVLAAVRDGGDPEYVAQIVKTTVKHYADTTATEADVDNIFKMSESQIREKYGDYADKMIEIIRTSTERIENEVTNLKFKNAGDYLRAQISRLLGTADLNVRELKYLDAEGLQSFAKDNNLNGLDKVAAQNLHGLIQEYLKYEDDTSKNIQDKYIETIKESQSYLEKRNSIENEYSVLIDGINDKISKELDPERRKTLELERQVILLKEQRDLSAAEYENWKNLPETRFNLENLSKLSKDQIEGLQSEISEKLKTAISTGNVNNAKELATEYWKTIQALRAKDNVFQAKQAARNLIAEKSDKRAQTLGALFVARQSGDEKALAEATANYEAASAEYYEALNNYSGAKDEVEKFFDSIANLNSFGKAIGTIGKAIHNIKELGGNASDKDIFESWGPAVSATSDYLSEIIGKVRKLAEETDNIELQDTVAQMEAFAEYASSIGNGFAQGGWIGALVSGLGTAITRATDNFMQKEIDYYKYSESIKEATRQIKLAALTIKDEDYNSIFGTNAVDKAVDSYKAAQQARKDYLDYVNKTEHSNDKYTDLLTGDSGKGYDYNVLRSKMVRISKDQNMNLEEYAKSLGYNLWDKDGVFNVEAARSLLSVSNQIGDSLKKDIQHAVDLWDAYEEARQVYKDLMSEWFGNWSSSMTDAVFDSIINGTDAWSEFEKAGAEAMLNIGKTLVQSKIFNSYLSGFEDDFENAWGTKDPAAAIREVAGNIMQGLPAVMDAGIAMAEEWVDGVKSMGYNMDALSGSSSGLSNSIKGVTEETADLLSSYINSMRLDLSVQRSDVGGIHALLQTWDPFITGNSEILPIEDAAMMSLRENPLSSPLTNFFGEDSSEEGDTSTIEQLLLTNEALNYQNVIMDKIVYETLPQMSVIAESQLAQLNMIAESTRITSENAIICADYAERTWDILNSVTNGVKKVSIE